MALDYTALGKRISTFRNASGLTQEQFCEKLNVSRKHISQIEAAISRPSLETLVDIANILNISADDLLVDSLTHSASTADSEIHRLLLDCKSLAWSSIVLALGNIKEEVVERPKALGNIRGVTYIYGMFYRFGLIDVPDEVKEKMGHPKNRKK